MNDKLKPCPFCGGMNLYYTARMFYAVECADCGGKVVGAYRTEEEAVEAWNRRVQPTFTLDEIDVIARYMRQDFDGKGTLERAILKKCNYALKGGEG